MHDALDPAAILLGALISAAGLLRLRARPDDWLPISVLVAASLGALGALGYPSLFRVFRIQSWGLFLFCPLWAVGAALVLRSTHRRAAAALAVAGLLVAAVGVEAFARGPRALELTVYRVQSERVHKPLRIALIADLQTAEPGPFEARALRLAMAQEPDLILFAGDYVQRPDRPAYEAGLAELNQLFHEVGVVAPRGVFAVRGNCEGDGWEDVFDGIALAKDPSRTWRLGDVSLSTLSLDDGFDPSLSLPREPGFHIVLAHGPDFALGEIDADLLLAGHTHGGQVQIPLLDLPILTFSQVPRAWAQGRTDLPSGRTLIVSRGIGMERDGAPPLRLFANPEVVIVDVVPVSPSRPRR